jgi:hypothetical protein
MSSCNDAAGVEVLSGPDLAILNAIARSAFPLTCLFQPQPEYDRANACEHVEWPAASPSQP